MADEMSFEEFRVDLAAMAGVISQVKGEAWSVEGAMDEIKRQFAAVETAWRSPSAFTFADLSTWFDTCQTELASVLTDMIGRLDGAYTTYHEMEQASLDNMNYTEDPPPTDDNPVSKVDAREDSGTTTAATELTARVAATAPTTAATELTVRVAATAPTTAATMLTARVAAVETNG